MKSRKLVEQLEDAMINHVKKIIFLWGPRQTGKSTILKYLYNKYKGAYFNFDNFEDQRLFIPELSKLESSIAMKNNKKESKFIYIDEVQQYPESTQSIKLLADNSEYIIIATGSSEMRAKTNTFDTLAGRYKEFVLFPLTIDELSIFNDLKISFTNNPNYAEKELLNNNIDHLMIYGAYPGVVLLDQNDKIEELKNLSQNSVIKDIVNIYNLRNTDLVYNLLRVLAMQIGNLINITELASSLRTTKITIDNYLSIFNRNRIIYLLEPYRENKRRSYLGRKKIYFIDLGLRNSLIHDFRPINLRQDFGSVFENLIISGILRQTYYQRNNNRLSYYRQITGNQKEIDLIIETPAGVKSGYEIKYNNGKINKFPELDIDNYQIISKENAVDFLL